MFKEYDLFILSKEIPDDNSVPIGSRGVVLMTLSQFPFVYEVEFLDAEGMNIGDKVTYTLSEENMTKIF